MNFEKCKVEGVHSKTTASYEDDTDRRHEYCGWFESMMRDDAFTGKVVWSDEAQFKLNGTVNPNNCVLVL